MSRRGEAYNAQAMGLNRKFRLVIHKSSLAIRSRHGDKTLMTRGLTYVFDT